MARRRVLVAAFVVVAALGGCVAPDPVVDDDDDDDDGPPPAQPREDGCAVGWTYNWSRGFLPKGPNGSQGHTGEDTDCWRNGNVSGNGSAKVRYFAIRERGRGSWGLEIRDGADDVFLSREFGPAPNVVCDDEGRWATPGNWTIDVAWWNATGFVQIRLDMKHHGDWNCP